MGDNGFAFGEHGLIDKRTAYEESMRVPMLMQCPELFTGGHEVDQLVANIDIAPTLPGGRGREAAAAWTGEASCRWRRGSSVPWREDLLYEYYWERNFPRRRRSSRFAAIATSTSAITASGTSTSCTTWKPIRWR